MCIIDHYPLYLLGYQRTEISGGLNISEKLGRDSDSRCLNPDFLILYLAALPLCYFTPHHIYILPLIYIVGGIIVLTSNSLARGNVIPSLNGSI